MVQQINQGLQPVTPAQIQCVDYNQIGFDIVNKTATNLVNVLSTSGPRLTNMLQFIAQHAILNTELGKQALELATFEDASWVPVKEALANEIRTQCASFNMAIPPHCYVATGIPAAVAAPVAPVGQVSPELSTDGLFGFSNANMLTRNIRWENHNFPLLERSVPFLGAFPRMIAAIHMFVVALVCAIIHAIPSMKTSWDTEEIQGQAGTHYHAAYRDFYVTMLGHAVENIGLSLVLILPIAGQIFANLRASQNVRHAYPTETLARGWVDSGKPNSGDTYAKLIEEQRGLIAAPVAAAPVAAAPAAAAPAPAGFPSFD